MMHVPSLNANALLTIICQTTFTRITVLFYMTPDELQDLFGPAAPGTVQTFRHNNVTME